MIRRSSYRVDVIRSGAVWGQLRCAEPPRIDMDASAAITRSLSVLCEADAGVQWLTDALRPVLILDGTPFSLGIFYPASCRETVSAEGKLLIRAEAYDRAWLLSRSKTETRLHLSAGTEYLAAVDSLLLAAGITLRLSEPSSAVLATDREDWDIGTSRLEIVNQLLSEINYAPIWFDGDGWARIEPEPVPDAAHSAFTYGGGAQYGMTVLARAIDMTQYDDQRGVINSSGKWTSSSTYKSKFIPVPQGAERVVLTPDASNYGYYSWLKNDTVANNTVPNYAGGMTGRVQFYDTVKLDIPADAGYLWIYISHSSTVLTPRGSFLIQSAETREVRRVRTSGSRETDAFGAANVFILICDNPDYDEPMTAVSVNDSPISAISTVRMGQRIAEVIKVDNIASQAALQARADTLRLRSALRGQTAEIETPLYPGHGCGDIINLNHPALGGIWRETGWSMTLGPDGVMKHRLERVILV